jgi:hypothetical protein
MPGVSRCFHVFQILRKVEQFSGPGIAALSYPAHPKLFIGAIPPTGVLGLSRGNQSLFDLIEIVKKPPVCRLRAIVLKFPRLGRSIGPIATIPILKVPDKSFVKVQDSTISIPPFSIELIL